MTTAQTVSELLASISATSVALVEEDERSLTYGDLDRSRTRLADRLHSAGVRRGDTVALVLSQGRNAIIGFLGASSAAVAAPLDARSGAAPLNRSITALAPRAVVTDHGAPRDLHIPAGIAHVGLDDDVSAPRERAGDPDPDDVALLLRTSGTTGAPKTVPLTHRNLTASAETIAGWFALDPDDLGLLVMPLFHIHGLVGGLLSSLTAGASVAVPGTFDALKMRRWLEGFDPTWFTAVPTMHHLVHHRIPDPPAGRLRFLRSSSSPLAPSLLADMEDRFGVPALEAYGMTEAAHQISANPIPPGIRVPGSVGLPTGTDIAIVDDEGTLLPSGQRGEVVIRGEGVFDGYPESDGTEFIDGWFRTGDLGCLDGAGYLQLVGRLREMINRGGETIAPREIDEVLLSHDDVHQAAAFAIGHDVLGEDVAAVVVPRQGRSPRERDLRRHARDALAASHVPTRIFIADEIPVGPTGKVQRSRLASMLGLPAPGEEPGDGSDPSD